MVYIVEMLMSRSSARTFCTVDRYKLSTISIGSTAIAAVLHCLRYKFGSVLLDLWGQQFSCLSWDCIHTTHYQKNTQKHNKKQKVRAKSQLVYHLNAKFKLLEVFTLLPKKRLTSKAPREVVSAALRPWVMWGLTFVGVFAGSMLSRILAPCLWMDVLVDFAFFAKPLLNFVDPTEKFNVHPRSLQPLTLEEPFGSISHRPQPSKSP